MVATIISNDLGLFNSQTTDTGQSQFGQGNERIYVNAGDGNLILQRQDQVLIGSGLDTAVVRTYNSRGQFTDDNGDNFRFSFNQRLIIPTDVNQPNSSLIRINGDGHETVYRYVSFGLYVSSDGSGAHDTLTLQNGEWTWTEGSSQIEEVYDSNGRFIRSVDPEGQATVYAYGSNGLMNHITDASGQIMHIIYDSQHPNRVVEINTDTGSQDQQGVRQQTQVQYTYTANGQLETVRIDLSPENPNDNHYYETTYSYDTQNRLTGINQTDGTQVSFAYDNQNRIIRVTEGVPGAERITRYDYELNKTHITEIVDPQNDIGYRTTLIYDDKKRLQQLITPPNRQGQRQVSTYTYDTDDNLISLRDARNHTTVYEYDTNGNQTKITDSLGNITERLYDEHNRLSIEISHSQLIDNLQQASDTIVNRFIYDDQQRLRFHFSGNGSVTETRYDEVAPNSISVLRYSGLTRFPTELFQPTQTVSLWLIEMIAAFLPAVEKQAIERTDTYLDFREQISRVVSYAKTDSNGQGVVDGSETITHYIYDQYGQLLKTVDARGTSPGNNTQHVANAYQTDYRYDGMGRLLSITHALDSTATTVHDYVGNQIHSTEKNGLRTTSIYNSAGELLETLQTDHSPGGNGTELNKTRFFYDELGRLRSTKNPVGGQTHQLYDQLGRLVASVDETGALTERFYNNNGQVYRTIAYVNRLSASALTDLQQKAQVGVYQDLDPIAFLDSIRPLADVNDRQHFTVYDADGRAVYTIDGEGYVTQNLFDAADNVVTQGALGILRQDINNIANLLNFSVVSQEQLDGSWSQTTVGSSHLAAVSGALANDILAQGLTEQQVLEATQISRFFYDAAGLLIGELDAEGFMTRYHYDNAGNLSQTHRYLTDTGVDAVTHFTGTLEQLTPIADSEDEQIFSIYNERKQLIATITAQGYVSEFSYDKTGNLTQQTDYANPLSATDLALVVSATGGDLSRARPGTNRQAGEITPMADPANDRISTSHYNQLNQLETVTDYMGAVTQYVYDDNHRLTETTVGHGTTDARTTKVTYNLQSRINGEQNALALTQGLTISHDYDAAGRKIKSTDVNGYASYFYYDNADRLRFSVMETDKVNQLGEVTEFIYNRFGEQEEIREYTNRIATSGLTGGALTAGVLGSLASSGLSITTQGELATHFPDSVENLPPYELMDLGNNQWAKVWIESLATGGGGGGGEGGSGGGEGGGGEGLAGPTAAGDFTLKARFFTGNDLNPISEVSLVITDPDISGLNYQLLPLGGDQMLLTWQKYGGSFNDSLYAHVLSLSNQQLNASGPVFRADTSWNLDPPSGSCSVRKANS